jgi:formate dehydrogenase subunit gamma
MKTARIRIAAFVGIAALTLAIVFGPALVGDGRVLAQTNDRVVEEPSPQAGNVPGGHLGTSSDSQLWRTIREGVRGSVSLPDRQAGVMIQSEGDNWRAWRNGPVTVWGGTGLLILLGVLALFFALRGRIKIDSGMSGNTVERFNGIERFAHWMTAVSFIVLALTGLNLLYGKHVLLPALGPDAFSAITLAGKYVHDFVSFAFMLSLVLIFVLWVRHNIPNRHDMAWLAQTGGLFMKGIHPPARKFNAGQKLLFWVVVLGGLSLTLSGISLLFPFEFSMFGWTFGVLNVIGFGLPTDLTPMQEMQLSHLWHGFVSIILIGIVLGHIYIGSLGMEGAFDAMGTGHVDENWAREHHSLWMAELKGEAAAGHGGDGGRRAQPAE